MFRKKLWTVAATACALAVGGALAGTPLVSAALAAGSTATLPRASASPVSGVRQPRIVGGHGAAAGDWGFMAFIAHFDASGNPDFVCSGTVVSPTIVLTAGHCATDEATGLQLDASGFAVVTGNRDWTDASRRQVSTVAHVIVSPAYVPATGISDAALLVLTTPTSAPAIPLATSAERYLDRGGIGAFIAGWGATRNHDPNLQTQLQWARAVVQRRRYCSARNPNYHASSQLCAVNPPRLATGTCNGDSGGPLVGYDVHGTLTEIGLTSQGPRDCDTHTADYFTAVIPLYPWIAGWIQAAMPPAPPAVFEPALAPLPVLSLPSARHFLRETFAGVLGPRFKRAHAYTARCSRRSVARFKCDAAFRHGRNDYSATAKVYFVRNAAGTVGWADTYTIRWVNDRCYHSGHRSKCAVHTRRGTY